MVGIDNRKDVDLTVLSANATVWSTLLDRLENTDRRQWKPIDIPYRNVPLAALANIPAPLLQQNNAAPAAVPIIPAQFDFDFDFPVDLVDRNAVFVLCILCFIFLLALSHVLEIF